MFAQNYKKMAGTSAVFLSSEYDGASPVERDGMLWSAKELHLDEPLEQRLEKAPMHNALALEGLEDYEPPENGDVREVESIGSKFIYLKSSHAWVQMV
jgi:hypothetical protein